MIAWLAEKTAPYNPPLALDVALIALGVVAIGFAALSEPPAPEREPDHA